MILGIDVSHHTGAREWRNLPGMGVRFAFVKASEGASYTDNLFDHHWTGMHRAGVPCGAYHFGRPGTDAAAQAVHFRSVVGELDGRDLQPVLDLEVGDGRQPEQVVDWALAFVARAEELFRARIILYTGGYWRRTLGDPSCPTLGERKLWTARYGARPILPKPWSAWSLWQFSDGIHSPPPQAAALQCNCDWNWIADDLDLHALTVAANPATATPAPGAEEGPWPGRYLVWPASPTVTGEDVRRWQERMNELGWPLHEDGAYGPACKRACLSLQRQLGLTPDGIVGPKTWQATFAPPEAPADERP